MSNYMPSIVRKVVIGLIIAMLAMGVGFVRGDASDDCAKLTFIGHASVKLVTSAGKVIYIDPYYSNDGYKEPADYILVTHAHSDHSAVSKCEQAEGCKVIRWSDALLNGEEYQTFEEDGVRIEAVPSGGGSNHNVRSCVGYIVTVDGVSVYHAGDVEMNERMEALVGRDIDYAMYPVDGRYTMNPQEASDMANMIGAKNNIPIHGDGDKYIQQALEFSADNKLLLIPGQTIYLK